MSELENANDIIKDLIDIYVLNLDENGQVTASISEILDVLNRAALTQITK